MDHNIKTDVEGVATRNQKLIDRLLGKIHEVSSRTKCRSTSHSV